MRPNKNNSVLKWVLLFVLGALLWPASGRAHPLGNFSISHYAAIRVERDSIELLYLIDMAEIPTFQETQAAGLVPEKGDPGLDRYLAAKSEAFKKGLLLKVNGKPLVLEAEFHEAVFPAGAGGLPTMKIGIRYRALMDASFGAGPRELLYRDGNFADRAGWKEVIAGAKKGAILLTSSVPDEDRSHELSDYPVDLLNSPPQNLEARLVFALAPLPQAVAPVAGPASHHSGANTATPSRRAIAATAKPIGSSLTATKMAPLPAFVADNKVEPLRLEANRQGTPRNAFTELIRTEKFNLWVILAAALIAAMLGGLHALEPGHGKTIVAAYLVGSRGTVRHALLLGMIVTLSHTAGVYLLGIVTLYASNYIVPDRLYPWLGVTSGLAIAAMGTMLFLRRCRGQADFGHHSHSHEHSHRAHAHRTDGHVHHGHAHPHHHPANGTIRFRDLLTLGISGGIVPCPGALVVLLSAVALNRVGFGFFLIVAFSVGLAAVLILVGLLMVYARRFLVRFQSQQSLLTHWLPVSSSAVIILLGLAIAFQAAKSSGLI